MPADPTIVSQLQALGIKVRIHETVRSNNTLKGIILNPKVSDAVRAKALAELTARLQPAEAFPVIADAAS